MLKTSKIVKYLEQKYPTKKIISGDKVGLIYGVEARPVDKVLVAIDLTNEIFEEAVNNDCQLIIVHHPFLYEPTLEEEWRKYPYKRDLHKRLINTNIGLFVIHSNYDNSKEGITKALIETLSFDKYQLLNNHNYGAIVETKLELNQICQMIKRKLEIDYFETNFLISKLKIPQKIAFLPGAGDFESIFQAHKNGANLIITSDIKWSTWISANQHKINLINISHHVENVFVDHIVDLLKQKFYRLTILGSKIKVERYVNKFKEK